MQFQQNSSYPFLTKLLLEKRAIFFCGAGISKEPPAGLPEWNKLRDYTLNAVASREKLLENYLDEFSSIEIISAPGRKGLTPELVASFIMSNCDGYFESFRVLEEGQPNANHLYLAQLAKAGYFRYLFTTNFDLFFEQALDHEKVKYRVYHSEQEFVKFVEDESFIHIFKLHGCISIPSTITATTEQQGRGLSIAKANVMEKLLLQYCFVFLGYSGADLKIDLDYLRMVSVKEQAQGFVWNFLETETKESVDANVAKLAELYGQKGKIIYSKLPELFEAIIDKAVFKNYTQQQEQEWQQQKNVRLQSSLQSWAEKHLSALQACNIFGLVLRHIGHLKSSSECFKRFATLCEELKDIQQLSIALNNLGSIYQQRGDYKHASEYYQQAIDINRNLDHKQELASALNNMGSICYICGDYKHALSHYLQAQELYQTIDDKEGIAATLSNVGMIYHAQGEYDSALDSYNQAIEIDRALGDKKGLAIRLNQIGSVYYARGEYNSAINFYEQAAEIDRALGDKKGLANCLNNMGMVYQSRESYTIALEHYQEAEKLWLFVDDKRESATVTNNIGMIHHINGDHEKALAHYQKAAEIDRILENKKGLATRLNNIASICYIRKEYDQALTYYQEALEIDKILGDKRGLANRFINIATVYKKCKDYQQAANYYVHALAVEEEINCLTNIALYNYHLAVLYEKHVAYPSLAITYYQKARCHYQSLKINDKITIIDKQLEVCREKLDK